MDVVTSEAKRGAGVYEPWSPEDTRKLLRFWVAGRKLADIARLMNLPPQRVRDKIRYMEGHGYQPKTKRAPAGAIPGGRVPVSETIRRNCLCCGRPFLAESRFLRLCPTHRGQA